MEKNMTVNFFHVYEHISQSLWIQSLRQLALKGTHRINTGVVNPGPALGLLWLWANLGWDRPYVCIGGPRFHLIVIFKPVFGAVLI